jgi:hypothetical protein
MSSSSPFTGFTLGDALQQKQLLAITDYQPTAESAFQLGLISITPATAQLHFTKDALHYLLYRHQTGDFGNFGSLDTIQLTEQELGEGILATDDSGKLNKIAILGHYHCVMSEYTIAGHIIWIRTEDVNGSETYTTIMLPSEY